MPPDARKAVIVSPVSRSIGVLDLAKSSAFYRDYLGFDIREIEGGAEAVSGPARIQFDESPGAPSVLFFETDNVSAMREQLAARGGKPSPLAKVNWIKMEMFEIRDPDGNALWFGQSFDKPCHEPPRPMFQKALPEFPVDDVAAAVTYYQDILGFHINYQQHDLGVMDRDRVTLLLIPRTSVNGAGSAYIYIENADELFAELRAKGASLQDEPISHPWGLRDFGVLDPYGNQIRFGQPFE